MSSVLIIVFILIVLVVFIIKNSTPPYKPTIIPLPQKIEFQKTATNQYGLGSFALDIVTIGGHGRLKEARFGYENTYTHYVNHFNQTIDAQKDFNDNLNTVGRLTYNILLELEKSRKLLKKPTQRIMDRNITPQFDQASSRIYQLRNIADEKNSTGVALLQGSTVGGLAAVGSWTLVAMFGSASTGTAIASLSGIAAHNSILAWFGGGALVAGGGGMAAGTVALGAIVALPIVIFSSYKTHSSARDLDIKADKIAEEIPKLVLSNKQLKEANAIVQHKLHVLVKQHEKISEVNKKISNLLYPNGILSKAKRDINNLSKQDFYTKAEAEGIDDLLKTINELNSLFDVNTDVMESTPTISQKK